MFLRIILALALVLGLTAPALAQSKTQIDITDNILRLGRAAAAQEVVTDGTIDTTGVSYINLDGSGAITGVILEAGTKSGQIVTIINKRDGSVTFAASGTSNVAYGTSSVIATLAAATFIWDDASSLWYPTNP